jgi:predicted Zn-dependent peptidase
MRLRRQNLAQSYLVRIAAAPPDPRSVLALSLAMEIVGADPDARLFQEVRERLGLGYDVGASVEHGSGWAVSVISASAAREHEDRLRETVERTCREAAGGFSRDELARARKKLRYRFARLAESRLDRALAHAVRAIGRQPSLAEAARVLDALELADVERAWRRALSAPTLTALLAG